MSLHDNLSCPYTQLIVLLSGARVLNIQHAMVALFPCQRKEILDGT